MSVDSLLHDSFDETASRTRRVAGQRNRGQCDPSPIARWLIGWRWEVEMGQADLITQLAPAIDAGRVVVHDSDDEWVRSLRRMFPVRASGVRWDALQNVRYRSAEVPRVSISDKADALRGFLLEFGSAAGLGQDDR